LSNKTDNDDNIISGFDKFKIDGRTFNINTLKRLAKKAHPEYFNTEEELFRVYFDLDLEVIYGKCFLEDITLVNNLGITQLIAVLSEISNI
jgi:hypothetical protein